MYEKVFAYLDAHTEDYAAQLCRWVEVPSVKGEATPGAPFGKDVRRMLDVAMADAKAFGYETRDFDGYACDITLPGESEEAIAVLGHLDVVPAGDNWATPPFTATRVGDQIFARGTSDDKGPALAALYAMNAIKAAGIPLKKSIRLILGCDEESGWEDMAYYCAHTEMPEVGFSPDASFPIINTEKGMIHGFFTSKLAEDGLQVKQLWTGERVNVIPGESKALIAGGQEVADKVAAYAEKTGLPYTAEVTADGVWVTAEGIPGHSAYPEGRRNAIGMMLVQSVVNSFGAETLAGYSAAMRIESICTVPMAAVGNAMSSYTAQNIGAGEYSRVRRGYRACYGILAAFALVIFAALQCFSQQLIALFLNAESSRLALETGTSCIRFLGWFYILIGLKMATDGVLRGAGDMGAFTAANLVNLTLRVVLAAVLAPRLGIRMVWYAVPVGWAANYLISFLRYRTGRWRERGAGLLA